MKVYTDETMYMKFFQNVQLHVLVCWYLTGKAKLAKYKLQMYQIPQPLLKSYTNKT